MFQAKLLVVDDDRNLLEIIKMRLESLKYEVTAVRSEDEARQAVAIMLPLRKSFMEETSFVGNLDAQCTGWLQARKRDGFVADP